MGVILIGLAAWFAMLPEPYNSKETKPENLLLEIIDNSRYISTDEIAQNLIDNDYILLVDVRTPEEFAAYRLPGSMNIPLSDLLAENEDGGLKWASVFNQTARKVVFYSNGSIYSGQAWLLARRINVKNIYVMQGGLNLWFETIINPTAPDQSASDADFARYNTRRAASMHFTGGGTPAEAGKSENAAPPVILNNTKPKQEEGGC